MAVDIFLKLDGVTGESRDSKHAKELDILSWSWGMSQSGTTHIGGGGGSGKVAVQDLHLTKYMDRSSPTLALFCCNGKHMATGTLFVRKAGGDNPIEYLKLEMKEILVTSYQTGGAGSDDQIVESISLNFASFVKTYTPQSKSGSTEGKVDAKWNIATNKAE